MFWYTILAAIDNVFFTLVRDCFKIILYLADVEIFNESVIKDFSNRVYMLLAVIMFFKIAVSTIQYLVDPDKLSDSSSGVGSILKNSAIAIILLVVVPEVFKFARAAQTDVASYIPAIIMGDEYGTSSGKTNVERVTTQSNNMTSTVMRVFYTPKTTGSHSFKHGKPIKLDTFKEQIVDGCATFDIWHLGDYFSTEKCDWNYTIILPVVVAGFMIFVLVSMAIDIAIRAIKFALLEILAPIPIVSYIDKGGKGAFESWLNEVKNVYLDLFIRIAVVYFIIFVIDKLVNDFSTGTMFKHMTDESEFMKGLILIFIIVGLLLFGKEAPKYLCDALGIKGTDKIGPMFKRAGGLFGSMLGGGRDTIAGARNKWNKLKGDAGYYDKDAGKFKKGRALRAAFAAAGSGARSSWASNRAGLRSAVSGKGFKETMDASRRAADRAFDLHEARKDAHVSWKDYQKEVMKNRMGIRQDLEAINAEIKAAQESSDKAKAALDYVHNNIGAKFSKVQFGTDYIKRMEAQLRADGKLAGSLFDGEFVVGVSPDGSQIKMSMKDMAQGGKFSINTAMNFLKQTAEDTDGTMRKQYIERKEQDAVDAANKDIARREAAGETISEADKKKARDDARTKANQDGAAEFGQMQSNAQGMLDELQGYADSFIVSTSARSKAYKQSVGFNDNPAFSRIIEEAKTAIITNSSSSFGIKTKEEGQAAGMIDGSGQAVDGMLGDWMGLNKKRGQSAQTENLSASQQKGAEAAAKQIADKYDKKS